MRRRKREYRYRDHSGGVTRPSINRLFHLAKIGELRTMRGIAWLNKWGVSQWAVIVRGTKGYARFEGFCWGYGGEGPHGLRRLFDYYRIPKTLAVHIAHEIPSPSTKIMEFWRLECDENNEKYRFFLFDEQRPRRIKEHLVVGMVMETNPVQKELEFA